MISSRPPQINERVNNFPGIKTVDKLKMKEWLLNKFVFPIVRDWGVVIGGAPLKGRKGCAKEPWMITKGIHSVSSTIGEFGSFLSAGVKTVMGTSSLEEVLALMDDEIDYEENMQREEPPPPEPEADDEEVVEVDLEDEIELSEEIEPADFDFSVLRHVSTPIDLAISDRPIWKKSRAAQAAPEGTKIVRRLNWRGEKKEKKSHAEKAAAVAKRAHRKAKPKSVYKEGYTPIQKTPSCGWGRCWLRGERDAKGRVLQPDGKPSGLFGARRSG